MSYRTYERLTRRSLLGAGLFVGTSLILKGCNTPSEATSTSKGQLIVTTYGGSWEEGHRTKLVGSFTQKHNADVKVISEPGLEAVTKIIAAKQNPPYDVVLIPEGPMFMAAEEGVLEPFSAELSQHYANILPQYHNEGLAPMVASQVLGIAYNPKRISTPPTSLLDLWKPGYRDRVGLPSIKSGLGTTFLVELARLEGGGENDAEAAFRKLAELRPNLAAVAPNPGTLATLLEQGEIDIAPHWFDYISGIKAKGASVDWIAPTDKLASSSSSLQAVKNAPAGRELAASYIDQALSLDIQTAMAQPPYNFLPTHKDAPVPAELATKLGKTTMTELSDILFIPDWKIINQNRAAWIERFNKEVKI
ncbi:extracellular solute-binding protein [Leptolyngbya sp. NK1-12]|uniref:Extracellular solute-binding protein n=1 Tax=Leptolyngbya sp. NK1-12 TaxID=2547451 RepID=A0AA96WJ04_9CYAN|nr:extracellular solute-binding protein [Leptolyngbya sp. NK1-12]